MTLLAMALAATLAQAPQLSEEEVKDQMQALLGSIDTPITAEHWKALGPLATQMLMDVASSGEEMTFRRARAIEALGMRQDAVAAPLVQSLAADEKVKKSLRLAAVRALPQVVPAPQAQVALEKALKSGDVHVRAEAAKSLSRFGPAACAKIQARLTSEQGEERGLLERAAKACKK